MKFLKEIVKKNFNLIDKDEYLELKEYAISLKKELNSYQNLKISRDYFEGMDIKNLRDIHAVNNITLQEIVNSDNTYLLWNLILINHNKGHINIIPYTVDFTDCLTKNKLIKKEEKNEME